MKEQWTEDEVKAFPLGEHDYFDRKSGLLLESDNWRAKLAKAVSAFANSGGGHILLGVKDDGAIDGVEADRNRQTTREWLEQVIPHLVSPPLVKFRVHVVIPASMSDIPSGRKLIVIEVDDSHHVPHQSEHDKVYYYRSGSHSVPAPHFYLEALRNRTVKPMFSTSDPTVHPVTAYFHPGGLFVQFVLSLHVKNTGRVMARYLAIDISCNNPAIVGRRDFFKGQFPTSGPRFDVSGVGALQSPLLPTLSRRLQAVYGLNFHPAENTEAAVKVSTETLLGGKVMLEHAIVCESSRSDPIELPDDLLRQQLSKVPIYSVLPQLIESGSGYAGNMVHVDRLHVESGSNVHTHATVECVVKNRSDRRIKDLQLVFMFRNREGNPIGRKMEHLEILEPGHPRPIQSWIPASEILGFTQVQVVAIPGLNNFLE